jgi:capsular exopolysaccharide synthesis family protein
VSQLPVGREPDSFGRPSPIDPRLSEEGGFRLRTALAVLLRNKWVILGCVLVAFAAAKIYLRAAERVYEATVRLRIDEKRANLPEIFQTIQRGSDVGTDIQVLGGRTLAEDAARQLGLQVRLLQPRQVPRETLLGDIQVSDKIDWREYRFAGRGDGSFTVYSQPGERVATIRPGEQLRLEGVSLRLKPAASEYKELRVQVLPMRDAVDAVSWRLNAFRVSADADIIVLRYTDPDAELVWQVPNVVAERFIETRRESDKVEARSQVKFLRQQIDTITRQLGASEEELKNFRQRARVVDPSQEASSQISRLVQLESERSSLEAERSSLTKLMAQVEQEQARRAPGAPSAYRQLLAFPSLLRSQAASQLMATLAQVEDQRATLLARRTEADPDVQLLTARIGELEGQLATTATTYLQGLNNQAASLDSTAARFSSELRGLPQRELEFARLDRKPTVLKEMYTLLQTRLKEAEIAQAVDNANITIVDRAIPPLWPIRPNPGLITGAGLVGGLLLGVGLALVREYSDRTVRTRADVVAISGLPVVGVVPRIARRSALPAVIANRSLLGAEPETPLPGSLPPARPSNGLPTSRPMPTYTFFSGPPDPESREDPTARPAPIRLPAVRPQVRMTLAGLGTAVAEAYGILQTNIAFSRPETPIKVLVLTSPLPGEGKTTTAVNLALTLSERGLAVCLIDADLRCGKVHEVFGLPREPGLSEVLQGVHSLEAACREVRVGDVRQLTVLTCGASVASPPGLVGSMRMRAFLDQLRERFDLIVVDTPPVNILTDAALIGANADGVLLVVRAGATDTAALGYAVEQLNHVRAPALGVVLNDVDIKRYAAYDDAYRYTVDEKYLTAQAEQG